MSDYMFTLESHLSADQFRVVGQMRALAGATGASLYLTGGAIRDMLAGFPVRDLDFTVEGNALKLAKTAAQKCQAAMVSVDDVRKSAELRFPGGVTAEVTMARSERYTKSGGRPQISPATIHEDLRGRDFTINAVALSLNRASLGLPIDPTNGVGDIERKEIRAIHNYSFYDDPSRILRMFRFKARLGFAIDERPRLQYENARGADMLARVSPEALGVELHHMANEPLAHDLMKALEDEKLLDLFSPALQGSKLNLAEFGKLQKSRQMAPFDYRLHSLPLFLIVLMEKLNAKEAAEFAKATALTRAEMNAVTKLAAAAKKLDRELKSPKLQKPSHIYAAISKAPGEQVLYLAVYSTQRLVHDRIRNYFQKHLPMAMEVTNEMVAATGATPGTPKFHKAKEELVLKHLDARPKKVAPPPEAPPPPPTSAFARGPGVRPARVP